MQPNMRTTEIGHRVTTKWTFKNDGSYRNGTITEKTLMGYVVSFDDGREEAFLNSTLRDNFVPLYDLPQPAQSQDELDAAMSGISNPYSWQEWKAAYEQALQVIRNQSQRIDELEELLSRQYQSYLWDQHAIQE